ncbi:MAG: hypothetical protein HOP29_10325 [Phycisphaerales bacterium]|nr:hypothetical protein [Phycisphaerales bacterium]
MPNSKPVPANGTPWMLPRVVGRRPASGLPALRARLKLPDHVSSDQVADAARNGYSPMALWY